MSDHEVRRILAERKRQERRLKNRAAVLEAAEDLIGWGSLLMICFMLSVIGG